MQLMVQMLSFGVQQWWSGAGHDEWVGGAPCCWKPHVGEFEEDSIGHSMGGLDGSFVALE